MFAVIITISSTIVIFLSGKIFWNNPENYIIIEEKKLFYLGKMICLNNEYIYHWDFFYYIYIFVFWYYFIWFFSSCFFSIRGWNWFYIINFECLFGYFYRFVRPNLFIYLFYNCLYSESNCILFYLIYFWMMKYIVNSEFWFDLILLRSR